MRTSNKEAPFVKKAAHVLLADENSIRRDQARAWISEAGYTVTIAVDGFEALSLLVENQPDIVFATVTMPRLDGYQLCSLIKSNTDFKRVPVIMLVNDDESSGSERASLSGCDSLLCKPADAQAFANTIDTFLCTT